MYLRILIVILGFISTTCDTLCQDATEIVRQADERLRGTTSQAIMTIEVIRPTWTRKMSMKTWTKGNELAMVLITSPVKEKGTVFLKRNKEVWNWVPSIERNIKLPPSMMSQSWMGTDFTNDDLVKEASMVEDYNHIIIGSDKIDSLECYKIHMNPKPESAIIWGKVIVWIEKNNFYIMKVEYYDEDNFLVNTMLSSEIKMLGGRLLPSRTEMIPSDKIGHKTVLIYNSLVFDTPINNQFFSTQNMQTIQ